MGYYLVIDQGNTLLKAGLFRGDRLLRTAVFEKPSYPSVRKFIRDIRPDGVLLSTVGKTPFAFVKALRALAPLTVLTKETPVPIRIRYKSPETLGSDRLAAAVGAHAVFPDRHVLVIDAGTCIKYDFIHKRSGYIGGSIAPGIALRLKVLHQATNKLPLVKAESFSSFVGNDTRTSILTGCITAAAFEAEGFIRHYRKKYGSVTVVLTGGDARILSKQLNFSIFAAPHLVLTGLNTILQHALSQR